jgi:4-amino-4-deoxychorismate lyase
MFPFIESIAVQNGNMPLIEWHQKRIYSVFKKWYPSSQPHDLESLVLDGLKTGLHKLRFLYDATRFEVDITPYQPKLIRSLQIVESGKIDYAYKYSDRILLDQLFEQRGAAEDIIIAVNAKPTDSYYANTCFFDGRDWFTPTSYLLNGVMRQSLLSEGKITEKEIKVSDLKKYQKVSLINALNSLGSIEIPTKEIYF